MAAAPPKKPGFWTRIFGSRKKAAPISARRSTIGAKGRPTQRAVNDGEKAQIKTYLQIIDRARARTGDLDSCEVKVAKKQMDDMYGTGFEFTSLFEHADSDKHVTSDTASEMAAGAQLLDVDDARMAIIVKASEQYEHAVAYCKAHNYDEWLEYWVDPTTPKTGALSSSPKPSAPEEPPVTREIGERARKAEVIKPRKVRQATERTGGKEGAPLLKETSERTGGEKGPSETSERTGESGGEKGASLRSAASPQTAEFTGEHATSARRGGDVNYYDAYQSQQDLLYLPRQEHFGAYGSGGAYGNNGIEYGVYAVILFVLFCTICLVINGLVGFICFVVGAKSKEIEKERKRDMDSYSEV